MSHCIKQSRALANTREHRSCLTVGVLAGSALICINRERSLSPSPGALSRPANLCKGRLVTPLSDCQHGGSSQLPLAQISQRAVGLAQRITRCFDVERSLGGQTHERKPVFAREVGH